MNGRKMTIIERISPEMMGVLRAMVVATPRRSIQSDQLPAARVPSSATRYGIVTMMPALSSVKCFCSTR